MSSVPPPSGSKGLHPFWPPNPELGGNKFLQSVGNYLPIGMMSHPKELNLLVPELFFLILAHPVYKM